MIYPPNFGIIIRMLQKTITSKENARLKHVRKLLADKDYRYQTQEYVIEGPHALGRIAQVNELFVRAGAALPQVKADSLYCVETRAFGAITSTENSQGIVATAPLKVFGAQRISPGGRYVLLDRIQDPGNMGAIMRSACAFGYDAIIITPGCVDPFSPKVVRAAAGALTAIDVIQLKNQAELADYDIITASMDGKDISDFAWPDHFIIAIGSEAAGLSPEIRAMAKSTVSIPISNAMESLNAAVAAGILLYLAARNL
ncbi:MAG: hypothetical protein A2219_04700 [Elusimicrobia bacterium RIFOXYA2_FULL_50_26]|nr:MAG: hypothetical protein A2219_04700 [Elusimicrobia bacterium RIFOXYA2_FULL_50_26]OGS23708.1 MAG: hypothetical protein A2314_01250 [Elusimicrobia bacterium RIFOXYB2_FULL_50_12]